MLLLINKSTDPAVVELNCSGFSYPTFYLLDKILLRLVTLERLIRSGSTSLLSARKVLASLKVIFGRYAAVVS